MSDYNSSLPIRTQNDGDVVVRISDATLASQQLAINSDGSVNITDNSGSLTVDAVNLDIRDLTFATDKVDASGSEVSLDAATLAALESTTVQNGAGASAVNIQDGGNSITVDAIDLDIRDLTFAADKVDASGSEVSLSAGTLAALESITVQNGAGGSAVNIQDGGNSLTVDGVVSASNLPTTADVNYGTVGASTLRSAAQIGNSTGSADFENGATGAQTLRVAANLAVGGANVSSLNPIPVTISAGSAGDEINNHSTAASLSAGGTSNHDYVVTTGKTLLLSQVEASASGKMKIEIQVETGAATGVFNNSFVQFNSTANPNCMVSLRSPISVAAGVRVRVIRTNRDNQSMDVYSTISGQEI